VVGVAVSPDGRQLAAACEDHALRLWDLGGPAPVVRSEIRDFESGVRAVAFSPDGKRLERSAG